MKKNEKLGTQDPVNTPTLLRLHRLIKSMTAPQKRDFRKKLQFLEDQAEKTKGNKSKSLPGDLQIFDAINRFIIDAKEVKGLQKYMERNHLGNRSMLSERASDLYNSILESLRSSPDRGQRFNRLNSLMQDINTLYHKGLYSDCQTLITEAHKLAREIDKSAYLIELLWWQNLLKDDEKERSKVNAATDSIKMAELQIIRHLVHTTEIRNIMYILSAESRHVDPMLDGVPDHWRSFFEMDLKDALQSMPGGMRARLYFLVAFRNFGEVSSKMHPELRQYWLERTIEAQEALITAYKNEFLVIAMEDPSSYWRSLENYLTFCHRLNREERADEIMEILEKEADSTLLIYHRLNKYLVSMDAVGAIHYIEKERLLPEFDHFKEVLSDSRQIAICYQCGFFYFLNQKWDDARLWFAKTMDGHRPDNHHVAVTIIGLLDILCIFELKAFGGSVLRLFESFEGRQKRANQWTPFLKSLMDILKNHLSKHNDHDIPERLEALQLQVTQDKLLGMYGVVLAWVEARLNKTDYLTEVKKYI